MDRRVFAERMREQKEWDPAVSDGWDSSTTSERTTSERTTYSFRVRRKSLHS
jgi:hypothetical protein